MEQTAKSPSPSWPTRKIVLATLAVVAILAAFWVFFRFSVVFFSLFAAVVLSTAFEPLINKLASWRVPRPVSVILISLLILSIIILIIVNIIPLLIEQWTTITAILSDWYGTLRETLLDSPSLLVRRIARQLPTYLPLTLPAPEVSEPADENSLDLVQRALDSVSIALRGLLILIAVVLLTGFWMIDGDRAIRLLLAAVPRDRREGLREYIDEVKVMVGAYTRGLVTLSLIIGTMSTISYVIIGLPNVLILGIIAGIMETVPLVGPLIGAIPALLVAVSTDPSKVIWVIIATFIFQTLENNLIVPRVMNRTVGVNPVASVLAFFAFGSIFGFVGALLAIPLAAVIQITIWRLLFQANPVETTPSGRSMVSTLRYEAQDLVQDVRKQVREKEDEPDEFTDQIEDEMEAIVQDLDSILAQMENEPQGNGSKANYTGQQE